MRQRIVSAAARPQFWLFCLLFWLLLSAARSLGTPWALAAGTEACRWGVGIALALALGAALPRAETAARLAAVLVGALALWGAADGFHSERGGVSGPFGDHQIYGSVLLVLLPFAVAQALSAREAAWRLGGQGGAVAGAACLALSQTRSAWAGALVGGAVFLALWLPRTAFFHANARRTRWPKIAVPAAVLLGVLTLGWTFAVPAEIQGRLSARAATFGAVPADGSWRTREADWRGAARLIASSPGAGIGLGRYPRAQWAWTHPGGLLGPEERPSLSEQAHSLYLQTGAETGLIGLGLYLAVLASFAAQALRRLTGSRGRGLRGTDALLVASLSMTAAQAVDALASPSWQFPEASLFFWAALGVGLAALRAEGLEPVASRSPALRRVGQLALSGAAAVVLAAQVLPLGLLSPVEAYTPPTGWTFVPNSLTLNGPSTVVGGNPTPYTYTLTATYIDAQQQQHLVDVTLDPVPPMTGTASYYGSSSTRSTFGTSGSATRNRFTASAADSGSGIVPGKPTLILQGSFYEGSHGSKHASLSVNVQ